MSKTRKDKTYAEVVEGKNTPNTFDPDVESNIEYEPSEEEGEIFFDEPDGLHKYDDDNEYKWNPNTKEWEPVEENANVEQSQMYLDNEFAEANSAANSQIKTVTAATSFPSSDCTGTQHTWFKCTHKPTEVIRGNNFGVYAGKKWDVELYAREYDLVMNLSGTSIREKHVIPIPSMRKWEDYSNINEIMLDWADMGIVSLPYKFWKELVEHIEEKKFRLLIFCMGGHGRTGTAVASILIAMGWTAKTAIDYVRNYYCDQAIENLDQEDYIYGLQKERDRKKRNVKSTINGAVNKKAVTAKPLASEMLKKQTSKELTLGERVKLENEKDFVKGIFTQDGKFYCTNKCSNFRGIEFSFIPKGTLCEACKGPIPASNLKAASLGETK